MTTETALTDDMVDIDLEDYWSLDSGDDVGGFPEDIIETVARANTAHVSNPTVLPEIKAAPCPIHVKRDPKKTGVEESHYWLHNHTRDPGVYKHRQKQPLKNISTQQNNTSRSVVQMRGNRMDINVRIPEQFPTPRAPILPKNMSSKDYVMSWLIHGSDPQETNHFPDIVPSTAKTKSKHIGTPRRSHISE
ncbi:hypothetical protein ACF0H5_005217 [Mactra antiquata]